MRPTNDGLHAAFGTPSQVIALGYVVLGLAGIGLAVEFTRGHLRKWVFWAALVLVALSSALGPELSVAGRTVRSGGEPVPNPLGLLLSVLPMVGLERVPSRHVGTAALGLAVLAGGGLAALGRWSWRGLPLVQVAALGALLVELFPAPFPVEALQQDGTEVWLQAHPVGAVIDAPFGANFIGVYRAAVLAQGAQVVHGHALVGGYVSRAPAHALESIVGDPLLDYLGSCTHPIPTGDEVRASLRRTGTRYVVIHAAWPTRGPFGSCSPAASEVSAVVESSGLLPVFTDGTTRIYAVVDQSAGQLE